MPLAFASKQVFGAVRDIHWNVEPNISSCVFHWRSAELSQDIFLDEFNERNKQTTQRQTTTLFPELMHVNVVVLRTEKQHALSPARCSLARPKLRFHTPS